MPRGTVSSSLEKIMIALTKFEIKGMFGNRDVSIDIVENKVILVGPNGSGKSSIASIFYYFISRQWTRLLEYEFTSITIEIAGEVLSVLRENISGCLN